MKIGRSELVAYILICVGVILLIITFVMAYIMLVNVARIVTSSDLSRALGEILGPIVEAVVKAVFLGIMGWIGSITTMRGIQLYRESKTAVQLKAEEKTLEKT